MRADFEPLRCICARLLALIRAKKFFPTHTFFFFFGNENCNFHSPPGTETFIQTCSLMRLLVKNHKSWQPGDKYINSSKELSPNSPLVKGRASGFLASFSFPLLH